MTSKLLDMSLDDIVEKSRSSGGRGGGSSYNYRSGGRFRGSSYSNRFSDTRAGRGRGAYPQHRYGGYSSSHTTGGYKTMAMLKSNVGRNPFPASVTGRTWNSGTSRGVGPAGRWQHDIYDHLKEDDPNNNTEMQDVHEYRTDYYRPGGSFRGGRPGGDFMRPRYNGPMRDGPGGPWDSGVVVKISNVEYSIMEEDLKELFTSIGEIKKVWIDYDKYDRSMGTGGCVFKSMRDAERAVREFDGRLIAGMAVSLAIVR